MQDCLSIVMKMESSLQLFISILKFKTLSSPTSSFTFLFFSLLSSMRSSSVYTYFLNLSFEWLLLITAVDSMILLLLNTYPLLANNRSLNDFLLSHLLLSKSSLDTFSMTLFEFSDSACTYWTCYFWRMSSLVESIMASTDFLIFSASRRRRSLMRVSSSSSYSLRFYSVFMWESK